MKLEQELGASLVLSELLKQTACGDVSAFGRLYDQSSSVLYGLLLRILGDQDEASDLLQEVYSEIWRRADRYDENRGTPLAWMLTMTRSRAIDRLRSREWKSRESSNIIHGGESELSFSGGQDPLESYVQQELREHVQGALAGLPSDQRQLLELAYFGGLSQSEIAVEVGEPLGTVKTRIRLGMIKLKNILGPMKEGLTS